jgi:hypothetical protein
MALHDPLPCPEKRARPFRAGRETSEDGLRQTAVRRISWGAAVLALGVAMTTVGLVLLVLVALVLAQ